MAGGVTLQILHISDLHIHKKSEFDSSVVLEPLLKRVEDDKTNGFSPELIVVTGDIALNGIKEEYDLAKTFFDKLLSATRLSKDRLFIVPGNHDVNRKKYRPNDIPKYETMRNLNDELENEEYRADLFKGMVDYFEFVKTYCPHLQSVNGNLVPFVHRYKTSAGKHIGIVGLNSSWMCRKKKDEREIAIGGYQVIKAMEELKDKGEIDLTISLFHHPMQWLWPEDVKCLEIYLKDSMILSGHFHLSGGGFFQGLNGSRFSFLTGAAYLGSESKVPARFQYITCDWGKDEIRLDFRKHAEGGAPKWVKDSETGDDGNKVFENAGLAPKTKKPKPKKPTKSVKTLPEIPEAYKCWVTDRCKTMDIDRLREGSKVVSVDLPEVYIPLMATPPKKLYSRIKEDSVELHKEELSRDIEELAAENDYLLVRGEAGSGKTTLIKHMAYSIIRNENAWNFNDRLPVLIFLKELKAFGDANKGIVPNKLSAEKLLAAYVDDVAQNGLDCEIIRSYASAGRIIFLVDGLDEIEPGFRDFVATSLAAYRGNHHGCKMIFSGRPHGVTGAAADRFGDHLVDVQDFNDDQIETFIRKWFLSVNGRESITGQKTAEMMISELKTHQDIDLLKRNPLMLTAICILYNDEKTLPEQRAELYKKFITHLLTKRFGDDHSRVHKYVKELAHDMFMADEKGVDGITAKKILATYYPDDTRDELDQRFASIENDSGLMRHESGKFRFSHLTFQEFLTATHMIDKEEEHYANPIRDHWTDDRFEEVIELYIGFLSLENSGMAHRIVKDALTEKDVGDSARWRLAARSLLDIHEKSRQADTVTLAVSKMREIIEKPGEPKILADAGDCLGWLGDTRDLKEFVPIDGGSYSLEDIGDMDIPSFEISKFPVTNRWYGEFVASGGYKNREFWSHEGRKWLDETGATKPRFWDDRKWICPNAPVVGVCLYEADAFTKWLNQAMKGKENDGRPYTYRLPTEHEWQAAAAGKEIRKYPWGKRWDVKRCNNRETGIGKTSSVGVFVKGKSPEDVYDMSGNVWELTSSYRDKNKAAYVLRGGSWFSVIVDVFRCADRNRFNPSERDFYVGFRCARI